MKSLVTDWILQKAGTEMELAQKAYCKVSTVKGRVGRQDSLSWGSHQTAMQTTQCLCQPDRELWAECTSAESGGHGQVFVPESCLVMFWGPPWEDCLCHKSWGRPWWSWQLEAVHSPHSSQMGTECFLGGESGWASPFVTNPLALFSVSTHKNKSLCTFSHETVSHVSN